METIFIVRGTTGEYSDRSDWIVCAYKDKARADDHATKAEVAAEKIFNDGKNMEGEWDYINKTKNEYDPKMSIHYTGTSYWVEECELID